MKLHCLYLPGYCVYFWCWHPCSSCLRQITGFTRIPVKGIRRRERRAELMFVTAFFCLPVTVFLVLSPLQMLQMLQICVDHLSKTLVADPFTILWVYRKGLRVITFVTSYLSLVYTVLCCKLGSICQE